MPVRIYDIAKKLGIESKEVIAKAKELGITTARVPSSSLDKITAAYLEEQLGGVRPKPEPPAPAPPEPVVVIVAAEPAPEAAVESSPAPAPAPEPLAPPSAAPEVSAPPPSATAEAAPPLPAPSPLAAPEPVVPAAPPIAAQAPTPPAATPTAEPPPSPTTAEPAASPAPTTPAAPPPTPVSRIGTQVGRIELRPRPQIRTAAPRQAPPTAAPRVSPTTPAARAGARSGETTFRTAPPAKFVPPATGQLITLKPPIVVRDLAEKINRKPFQLIADLMELGVFATVNQAIEEPIAQRIAAKYGFRFEVEKRERGGGTIHAPKKPVETDHEDKPEELKPRAPVITIMGHVDHGKTTLLDTIRKSNVAAREAGGITQHIGAYTISIPHPERKKELQQITFLDTPGHAAFSAMRARGATVTDIVVLVVAANDGVMPQTMEALSHAQAAKVPIVVAVNKCDHPNANAMKVRQQLQDKSLVCEEWGGNTIFVDCSGLTGKGVDKLLEMLVLQAEYLELKANPNRAAKGNVIESGVEPGGPTATVLVRKGTLKTGDVLLCGEHYGKVRALINEEGSRLKEAGPSVAVKVLGLNGVPEAGQEFTVVENDKDARAMATERAQEIRSRNQEVRQATTLDDILIRTSNDEAKVLRVVVKADTQGSVEAIVDALKKIESTKVSLEIVHSAVGTISENDVILASASKAVVFGFHTRVDNSAAEAAKREGVVVKLYAIIYELIDQVMETMSGLLDPITREVVLGSAEVRKVFPLSKGGNVAGCAVTSGRIVKGRVRVVRRKNVLFEGLIGSLRRFQDEANEVRAGMECGIRLNDFNDFQTGDLIESYALEKIPQKL